MSTIARLTVAEYDRMLRAGVFDQGRRVEFIEGEIREMTPMGPEHETAIDQLTRWSFRSVGDESILIRIQQSLDLGSAGSVPQPDLAWVRNGNYLNARPAARDVLLLVEVANASRAYDLGEKANLYAAAGIRDYWVVDCVNRCIVVHREPGPSGYSDVKSFSVDQPVSPLSHPEVSFTPRLAFAPTGAH